MKVFVEAYSILIGMKEKLLSYLAMNINLFVFFCWRSRILVLLLSTFFGAFWRVFEYYEYLDIFFVVAAVENHDLLFEI